MVLIRFKCIHFFDGGRLVNSGAVAGFLMWSGLIIIISVNLIIWISMKSAVCV